METLREVYSYDNNLDEVVDVFEKISRELKIIHSNKMIVPDLNSKEIYFGESMFFKNIRQSDGFEAEKRKNILSLAKIMIGIYLSSGTGFKDFSLVNDEWFVDNLDTIFDTIKYEDFDKEYFSSIFLDGKNYYYSDYLDRKRQSEALQGNNNIHGFTKVLRNAGSNLYEDLSDIENEEEVKEKNANIQISFNPLLIGISIAIITVLLIMFVLAK